MDRMLKLRKDYLTYELTRSEVEDPHQLILRFFDLDTLDGHLEHLRYWRGLVLSKACYAKGNCPANLLTRYEVTQGLIEAAWLLHKEMETNVPVCETNIVSAGTIVSEEECVGEFYLPCSPDDVLDSFFEDFGLDEYQHHLYQWLSEGLSCYPPELAPGEVAYVYHRLRSLFEAAWLIHERRCFELEYWGYPAGRIS